MTAGSCAGMRAYLTHPSDLSEVENWIAAGFPVGLSLCRGRLDHPLCPEDNQVSQDRFGIGNRPHLKPCHLRRFP
jgi:hypothetical protein